MNSAIPSLLLLLWQNESLYETIGTKMSPVRSFAGKLRDFHVNRFAQALVLRTRTRMWKKSLHMCYAVHQASAHSSYSSMKRLGVFLSPPPPGWDVSLSQGYPPTLFLPVPIYTPERMLRHCESKVSRPRTQYNVPS